MGKCKLDLNRYQAVLFDLDGTLVHTEQAYIDSTAAVLAQYHKHYDLQWHQQFMQRDTPSAARWLVQQFELPITPAQFLQARNEQVQQLFANALDVPGVSAFVFYLQQQGLPMAIATSSLRVNMRLKLQGRAWAEAFALAVCGDDTGIIQRKPAADIFLMAAEQLGVAAADCLAFEDSPAGVAAASAAGMDVIAVQHPELPLLSSADKQGTLAQIDDYRTLIA